MTLQFNSKKIYKKAVPIIFCYCLTGISLISYSKPIQNKTVPIGSVRAIQELTERVIPAFANKFIFRHIAAEKDFFELEQQGNKILIGGNNANSMAMGLNYYLKYYCNTDVSWYRYDSVYMPQALPRISEKVRQSAHVQNRFFLNYCTFGYTMPWWKWADWRRFIDWMALNGINMPLAITGQEAIWQKVWKKLGMSDMDIRSFFTGPAYLPWNRMANVDSWDGPLPQSWIDNQFELQKKILRRERELDMRPVLPAFAGHVPLALKSIYPNAKIKSLGEWGGFGKDYSSSFLDPFDSLYNVIQQAFINEQTRSYGTDHIYGIDPFNELTPPSWEPDYLARISISIYHSIQTIDPKAKWIQMSWMFYHDNAHWTLPRVKSFLTGVPQGRMILLDYFAEKTALWRLTDKFFNQPYIWCYLGNFGGNSMLGGDLRDVELRMEDVFNNGGDNLWGIGSTLEGFGYNPMMYEYVFEKAWSGAPTDLDRWIKSWSDRRLGIKDKNAELAWQIMINKIYPKTDVHRSRGTLTNARPSLTGNGNWTTDPWIGYKNTDLLGAWELLLKPAIHTTDVYQFDVVNIGRQVLGNYFLTLRDRFTTYFENNDVAHLQKTGKEMIDLLEDLNRLLATDRSFLLGKWLEDAKQFGKTVKEKNYFQGDARKIITTWGKKGSHLNDYANRSWAGLTETYYKARWEMFIKNVIRAAKQGTKYNEKAFLTEVENFEWEWTKGEETYPTIPSGNVMQVARRMFKKYEAKIRTAQ